MLNNQSENHLVITPSITILIILSTFQYIILYGHMSVCMHMHTWRMHTHVYACMHTCIHSFTCSCTHMHTHTHTHTHTLPKRTQEIWPCLRACAIQSVFTRIAKKSSQNVVQVYFEVYRFLAFSTADNVILKNDCNLSKGLITVSLF